MLAKLKSRLKPLLLKIKHERLSIGGGCTISQTTFGRHVRIGDHTTLISSTILDYSYIGNNSVVCRTSIGKYCSIASDTLLGTGSHPAREFVSSHPIFYLFKPSIGWDFVRKDLMEEFSPTVIGNDVWIGARVTIRDGVRIGDGAIVGAGAVVVKDLEPYGVYVGVPATLLRYRFEADEIRFLREFRWWDKDELWIRKNVEKFHSVSRFTRGKR